MSAHCNHHHHPAPQRRGYRRALLIALIVNAAMFGIELGFGLTADSAALLADALDFFGDAANYAIALAVLGLAPVWRARSAWLKGLSMGAFGVFVLGRAAWGAWQGAAPEPLTMGVVGALALAANLGVAALLYAWREGDATMRSVWLCTRNDAIGNLAVLAAAAGVFGSGTAWPDLAVAALMAGLALSAAASVMRQAQRELRTNTE